MEFINFNDFSVKERHEIITAFLIKMRQANSMESAHSFFDYYLKQFYKMPPKLIDDIIYCQRAMKTYLSVHQRVTNFFDSTKGVNCHIKDTQLLEIEDVLHEINAECQYLVMRLEEDIAQFCLPFTEQQLQSNSGLISQMVSQAIVPHVSSGLVTTKPHFVAERQTESQLLRKYFATSNSNSSSSGRNSKDTMTSSLNTKDESAKPTRIVAPNKKTPASTPLALQPPRAPMPRNPMAERRPNKNDDTVNASRLHLQAVLKRTRLNQNTNAKSEPKAKSSKELFLHSFGLCTHSEHKDMLLNRRLSHKRKPRLTQKWSS